MSDRLRALDGLRGVAVLSVLGFHYFYYNPIPHRDTSLQPFGDAMLAFPVFKYGYLGVYLFFVISGFVIALTLERCATPMEFVIRRVARIWPALAACSILTYTVVDLSGSPYSLSKAHSLASFLPSLTLTPTSVWQWVSPNVDLVDGVYWTLLVEARFYLIALGVYFFWSRHNIGRNLVVFVLVNILARAALQRALPGSNAIYGEILIPDFMPWFAAGAVFYDLYRGRLREWPAVIMLVAMFLITVRTNTFQPEERSQVLMNALGATIFALFWAIARGTRSRPLEAAWLVAVGRWSYSIYLLHFGIGMCLISLVPKDMGLIASLAAVFGVALIAIGLGAASFHFIETPGQRLVTFLVGNRRRVLALQDQ